MYLRCTIQVRDYRPHALMGRSHQPHGGNGEAPTPPFLHGSRLFPSSYCFVWDERSRPRWCCRAQLGLGGGELNPSYLETTRVVSPTVLTDLPKFELFFIIESKRREQWFCSHLLAFRVNKIVCHEMVLVKVV